MNPTQSLNNFLTVSNAIEKCVKTLQFDVHSNLIFTRSNRLHKFSLFEQLKKWFSKVFLLLQIIAYASLHEHRRTCNTAEQKTYKRCKCNRPLSSIMTFTSLSICIKCLRIPIGRNIKVQGASSNYWKEHHFSPFCAIISSDLRGQQWWKQLNLSRKALCT